MNSSFLKNPCNRYLLLWCLYEMKGTLYPEGSIISRGLMLIVVILSFIGFFSYYQSKSIRLKSTEKYFKAVLFVLLIYSIYGIELIIRDGYENEVSITYYYLQAAYITFLPVFTIYVYTKRGLLTIKQLQIWVVVFIIVGICQYHYAEATAIARILEKGRGSIDELTNNTGYVLLTIMPVLLVYYKKPLYMYVGLGVCSLFILMSMKRGAIMIAPILLILIIHKHLQQSKGTIKFVSLFFAIIGVVGLFWYIMHLLETSDFFNTRIMQTMEGDSSNRDVISQDLWDYYKYRFSTLQKVFGLGGMGTVKTIGMYAHNDWIETLFDQGLLGFLVFLNYIKSFFVTVRNKSFSEFSKFCLLLLFIIFFLKSFYSMSICGMGIFMAVILGFALADGFRQTDYSLTKNSR